MYDYEDIELNKKYYGGQEKPPAYPLEKIQDFPIALFYGHTDLLCSLTDTRRLKDLLQSQNSLLDHVETEHGHVGIINPRKENDWHITYMIDKLLKEKVMDACY